MHFMLQKEVVKRMVASPNCKAFGRLSVMTQYYCHAIPVIEVPPECFKPAPKVDSAVIRLIPKKPEQLRAKSTKLLNTVCLEAFNQRRKTIRNSLSNLLTADEMASIGLDIKLRAENLSLEQYIDIANWYMTTSSNLGSPIKVSVETFFIEGQSEPDKSKLFLAYTITIKKPQLM
eukprot:TRINITY_DN26315_c0_g1_i1.p1 TRINITY_DN26315_c0_g1~~TRINITY_DN26315_c0_g1_i1.p1  ORF type:complete len:175 (+),score=20.46 TRINITY_DN26315_c0_g1_i1:206-730(+)